MATTIESQYYFFLFYLWFTTSLSFFLQTCTTTWCIRSQELVIAQIVFSFFGGINSCHVAHFFPQNPVEDEEVPLEEL
ncbi:hypothetical protein LWI28_011795 [Acer negundo]|uniref:Uncharacterized protein n=1 Tax=Acer negundo TaxID=4023 RepID=A0AAD5IEG9_ACENE|nr:hypothetical protein LWI28_011795 [Acer negundo]KAK4839324.1 hypothetical protein QYF36_021001 [Acer negundo]